jgi:hypothetical protein
MVVDLESKRNDSSIFLVKMHHPFWILFKELNPRRRVYVEIPKPLNVELK